MKFMRSFYTKKISYRNHERNKSFYDDAVAYEYNRRMFSYTVDSGIGVLNYDPILKKSNSVYLFNENKLRGKHFAKSRRFDNNAPFCKVFKRS